MKYPISRYLLTITMGAIALIGYTACSDDSSSKATQPDQQTIPDAPVLPATTEISPVIPSPLTITSNPDQTKFRISGGATLNLNDTTAIPAGTEVAFTNMTLDLVKLNPAGGTTGTPLQVTFNKPAGAIGTINWYDLGASINDENKSDCGTFMLYATYMASYDANNPSMYVSRDSATFVREDIYCQEIVEDTTTKVPEAPGANIELVFATVNVGTKDGTGISLASMSAVPVANADLTFSSDELTGVITIRSANGVQITEYTNQKRKPFDDDWTAEDLPPAPAHMSDFRFSEKSLTTAIEGFDSFMFYVATTPSYNSETGDGFYAFTLQSKAPTPEANGNIPITVLIYKKK